jgi:hypothetical protein
MLWMATCAVDAGLPPAKFKALCITESRGENAPELSFRTGQLGNSRYWGPGGLNQDCFTDPESYKNPWLNVYYAAQAMRRLIKRYGSWDAALRRYNTTATPAYLKEIARITKKLKEAPQ